MPDKTPAIQELLDEVQDTFDDMGLSGSLAMQPVRPDWDASMTTAFYLEKLALLEYRLKQVGYEGAIAFPTP